jgi:hypothetical protein
MKRTELMEKIRTESGDLSVSTLIEHVKTHRSLLHFYEQAGERDNVVRFRNRLRWLNEELADAHRREYPSIPIAHFSPAECGGAFDGISVSSDADCGL